MTDPDHVSAPRALYDAIAPAYVQLVGTVVTAAVEGPLDRAMLGAFVELLGPDAGAVADLGCGTGRVTAFLAAHGIDVVGLDLSHSMLAAARVAHPGVEFVEGRLSDLPFPDRSLGGAVSWYSLIYTPPARLPEVFAELARVLVDGAQLLVGFQAGRGESLHREDAFGSGLPLTSFRHAPDDIAVELASAGLPVHSRAERDPQLDHESTRQAFLIARRARRGAD